MDNLDKIFNEALSIVKVRHNTVIDCLRFELGTEVSKVLHLEISDDDIGSADEFEITISSCNYGSSDLQKNNLGYSPTIKVFARTVNGLVAGFYYRGLLLDSFSKPVLIADIAAKLFKY